jgi:signal transduction histidine kinase/CheY-like chemotaxis protein
VPLPRVTTTLRARLLLLVMAVLLPALAAALSMIWQARAAERVLAEHNMRHLARSLSLLTERELDRRAEVALQPQELHAMLARQALPPGWTIAILDPQWRVVASQPALPPAAGGAVAPLNIAPQPVGQMLHEEASEGLGARTVYAEATAQGWLGVAIVPDAALAGGRQQMALPTVVGVLLLLLLALGTAGALLMGRHIAGAVQSLQNLAENLRGSGNAPMPAPPRTGIAECDEVAVALVETASALRSGRRQLQRRVDEAIVRTRGTEQRVASGQRLEAMGRLTGGVAHDFNNLLGVISNSAHLIKARERAQAPVPGAVQPVEAILRAVDTGSRLTQHLLRFAGRQAIRPQLIDLDTFLDDVNELLRTVLGKSIALDVRVDPGTPAVRVDAGELELALINLSLNARDASEGAGQVRLHARTATPQEAQGLGGGAWAVLEFGDSGSGIAPELLDRVTEPFFTTKKNGQGTGLGLSQVHGFCRQAGGAMRVASTPGQGATVSLLLPAAHASAGETAPSAAPLSAPAPLCDCELLFVEDNEELGRVTALLLESFGCRVHHMRGAPEALEWIDRGGVPTVLLSDVQMPGDMDGVALARALRVRMPGLPVVLVSAYTGAQFAMHEFALLQKPYAPTALHAALREALDARRRAGA